MNASDRPPEPVTTGGLADRPRYEAADRVVRTYEGVADGLTVLDRDWRYTYVNPAAERMIGRSRENLVGTRVWDAFPFVPGTDVAGQLRRVAAALVDGTLEVESGPGAGTTVFARVRLPAR